jgi:TonB family protein
VSTGALASAASLLLACGSAAKSPSGGAEGHPGVDEAGTPDASAPGEAGPTGSAEPPELPPKVVPLATLEALRTGGTRQIDPDEPEQAAIAKLGHKVVVVHKLCIDTTGKIDQLRLLKSSGYPAYDQKVKRELEAWAFQPYKFQGEPTAACTAVTLVYRPSQPTAPVPTPDPKPSP